MKTGTYPGDVSLAVVIVAASREGAILSIKLLWLLKQDTQRVESGRQKSSQKPAFPPDMKTGQKCHTGDADEAHPVLGCGAGQG